MREIKWMSIIPLLGGMSLGVREAVGTKPSMFVSYPDFAANDMSIRNRWPEIPYLVLDPETNWFIKEEDAEIFKSLKEDIQICNGVPPCAGLSMLNSGGHADAKYGRGSDAVQNQWMYKSADFILEHVKPDVYFSENAPGLYTSLGEGVATRLSELAEETGYSFSIIKTNTKLHGIPQNRPRSFYFFWKSESAPIMSWYDRPMPVLPEYIKDVPRDAPYFNIDWATKLVEEDPFYQYIRKTLGPDYRQIIKESGSNSFFQYLDNVDKFAGIRDYLIEIEHDYLRTVDHMIYKRSIGKGYWDWSIHIFPEVTNATVSRNMQNTLHPTEERVLTLREYMHMMGLPHDFTIAGGAKNQNHIAQNVPVCTARDWTYEVVKFLNDELPLSGVHDIRQDNNGKRIDTKNVVRPSEVGSFITECL
jgi:site-specific DNA-cytosine methylase